MSKLLKIFLNVALAQTARIRLMALSLQVDLGLERFCLNLVVLITVPLAHSCFKKAALAVFNSDTSNNGCPQFILGNSFMLGSLSVHFSNISSSRVLGEGVPSSPGLAVFLCFYVNSFNSAILKIKLIIFLMEFFINKNYYMHSFYCNCLLVALVDITIVMMMIRHIKCYKLECSEQTVLTALTGNVSYLVSMYNMPGLVEKIETHNQL